MGQIKFKVREKTETEAGFQIRGEMVIDDSNKSLFKNGVGSGQVFINNLSSDAAEDYSIGDTITLPAVQ